MVRLGLTVALVLLGLDQLTKWVVLAFSICRRDRSR